MKAGTVKLVDEDEYGAYRGVTPAFLQEFVAKETNPNFDVFDSKDGRRRFIAARSSRMPDDQDLSFGRYGINFHRAKPALTEASRYHVELSQGQITRHGLDYLAFAAADTEEYHRKSTVWDRFYSYVWGETPCTLWVTPHSGSVNRKPDSFFPFPRMEMDAYVAGIAARCALNDVAGSPQRTMISIHSHNWLGAVLDLGGFGVCDEDILQSIAAAMEKKYSARIQALAADCRQDYLEKIGRWLEHIKAARGTLDPRTLKRKFGIESHVLYFVNTGLKLYDKEIKDFTVEEFRRVVKSLESTRLRVVSCNHLFSGQRIGRLLEISNRIDCAQMRFALQIECMKYYLRRAPGLVSDIILDVKNLLIRG